MFFNCRVPRIKLSDGSVVLVSVPWSHSGSGFTLLFEAYCMTLIQSELSVSDVASLLGVTAPRIWRVFDYWMAQATVAEDLSEVSQLGIDETSSKKGHKYITVFVDMENRNVIDVQADKDSKTITNFVEYLESKKGDRNHIENVCIDMSPAFISGTRKMLPSSKITFDKFHIVQHINKAMDTVRKDERKGNDLLKNHKYTYSRLNKNLTDEKRKELEYLNMLYPNLGDAYRLKEMFLVLFQIKDSVEAKLHLTSWCDLVMESGIQPFVKFVCLLKGHWSGIVNYFDTKLTNGILEGINSKIQLAKRRARGFRNIKNFINMIILICGKIKFNYPLKTL